jgi:lipopolysaccharide/colanic/teichoic acid biosynthesis glycosyltransferase
MPLQSILAFLVPKPPKDADELLISCKLMADGERRERCETPVNSQKPEILAPRKSLTPPWSPHFMDSEFFKAEGRSPEAKESRNIYSDQNAMPQWKRIFDLTIAILAMPVLGICTLFMMVLMKICSPGPVFFTQERVGYKGRRFKIYKFRTMYVGADTRIHQAYFAELMGSQEPMVKLDSRGDARLIPCGRLIRASGLDELPQLINVVLGDMSVIGPRPCLASEYQQYLPWQTARVNATPGLTGLWQVSGKNHTTFEEMIRLDIEYAQTRSPLLDAKIIFMTVPAILTQLSEVQAPGPKRAIAAMRAQPPLSKVLTGKP